jgi:hypothetical protein
MTVQLATRIDPEKKEILEELHKKTHLSIRYLTEKAIGLLGEHYKTMKNSLREDVVDDHFSELLEYSMVRYDKTYENLSK